MVRVKQTPRRKLEWWEKLASPKKKGKTCLSLDHLARRYPDITKTVCFYPKQATMRSLINATPRRTSKVQAWYK